MDMKLQRRQITVIRLDLLLSIAMNGSSQVYLDHKNFFSAEQHCHQEHGTLAYALSSETNKLLTGFYRKHSKGAKEHDFLMGILFGTDNKWKLVNGTEVAYFNWDIGMPTNNATGTVVAVGKKQWSPQRWRLSGSN